MDDGSIDHLIRVATAEGPLHLLKTLRRGRKMSDYGVQLREKQRLRRTKPALPLRAYAGRYANPVLGEVAVEAADRGLQLRGAQFELPMTHWHLDSFLVEHPPWDLREFVEFHIGPEGEVRSFDLFGETFTPRAEAARP